MSQPDGSTTPRSTTPVTERPDAPSTPDTVQRRQQPMQLVTRTHVKMHTRGGNLFVNVVTPLPTQKTSITMNFNPTDGNSLLTDDADDGKPLLADDADDGKPLLIEDADDGGDSTERASKRMRISSLID